MRNTLLFHTQSDAYPPPNVQDTGLKGHAYFDRPLCQDDRQIFRAVLY